MPELLARGAQDTTDRPRALVNGNACKLEDVLLSKKIIEVRQWTCHTVVNTTRSVRK